MKIKSTVLKDYCLTIIYVLRDIGPSFDIGFIFYNTIAAQLGAVNTKCLPNLFWTRKHIQVDVQSEAPFSE